MSGSLEMAAGANVQQDLQTQTTMIQYILMTGKVFSYLPLRQVFAGIKVVTLACVPGELANLICNSIQW